MKLGSVRSATNEYATLEQKYEYDIFGTPYEGDFSAGLSNGYTGKPYDTVTGLYNYGYRDYSPQVARFTTVDPIRDGNNWFSYVVNDPVNYVDLWGLSASDATNTEDQAALDRLEDNTSYLEEGETPQPQVSANPNDYMCDIYAWNEAIDNDIDPRGPNGEVLDLNNVTVNDMSSVYMDDTDLDTLTTPEENSEGYVFFSGDDGDTFEHVEYYEYTTGDGFYRNQTNGIDNPVRTYEIFDENRERWYVPLEEL